MFYLYLVSSYTTFSKEGRIHTARTSGTIKLRYPICDLESMMKAQEYLAKDAMLQIENVDSIDLTIMNCQLISTNPF